MSSATNSPAYCIAAISESLFHIALNPDLVIDILGYNDESVPQIILIHLDFHLSLGRHYDQKIKIAEVAAKILSIIHESDDADVQTENGFRTHPLWKKSRAIARAYLSDATGYLDWDNQGTQST